MKLTENEIEFFKNLHSTEVSGALVSYLNRLCDFVCDSRNWDSLGIEDKNVAMSSAKVIEQQIIDRLILQTKNKKGGAYQYD